MLVIDNWVTGGALSSSSSTLFPGGISLVAGTKYNIQLNYYVSTSSSQCALSWSTPDNPAKTVIPSSALSYAAGGLIKTGGGTVTLTGANTYGGNTVINAGTLKLGASGVIPDGAGAGNVTVNGTLDVAGQTETINGLSGSGTVDNSTGTGTYVFTVGANNQSGTFSGVIKNTSGTLSLTKTGAGTLTLGGVNTYKGATAVTAGKLVGVTGGSCASSGVTVSGGATNGVQVTDNTKSWTCAALTYGVGTTYLDFNFGYTNPPSTTVAPLQSGDFVDFSFSTPIVTVEAGNLPAGTGSYPLITWVGQQFGAAPTAVILPPHASGNLSVVNKTLYLNITANTRPLEWGAANNFWDINITADWRNALGALTTYGETNSLLPGDAVVFEDTQSGASPTVTLNTNVNPGSVTANNSLKNFTLTGSGSIGGGVGLTKQGTGTLTVANTNTYTGGTVISAGTLQLGDGTANNGVVAGTITDNASLVFANPNAQLYWGVIIGTGTLTKQAAGVPDAQRRQPLQRPHHRQRRHPPTGRRRGQQRQRSREYHG